MLYWSWLIHFLVLIDGIRKLLKICLTLKQLIYWSCLWTKEENNIWKHDFKHSSLNSFWTNTVTSLTSWSCLLFYNAKNGKIMRQGNSISLAWRVGGNKRKQECSKVAIVNHIRATCDTVITILVWRHNSIRAKCVTINVWRSCLCVGNSPHVQHVRVGPGFFGDGLVSFTHQWDGKTELLHHRELPSRHSCLNGRGWAGQAIH